MNSSTHPDALKALEKAIEALESAVYDLQGGFILTAVNRAYYTCYYCMAGLLLTENVYAKTHQGVKAKFSELFIKTVYFRNTHQTLYSGCLKTGRKPTMILTPT